jgi:hypothetical protein
MDTNSYWERLWKSSYVNGFSAEVVDDTDTGGSQALKVSFTPISDTDGGSLIKLRTITMTDMDTEFFKVSFKARTDSYGAGKVMIGAHVNNDSRHLLTENYMDFFDTVALNNDRLFMYFNNMDLTIGENYNIWIDDLKISYAYSTSIDDQESNNSIQVYPNPTKGTLILNSKQRIRSISIYNIHGQLMLKKIGHLNLISFDQFKNGVYFIEIFTPNSKTVHRIIKA